MTGVRVQLQPDSRGAADLVVDASGRGSHSPAWLDALGYAMPREEGVQVHIGYMTRPYRRRPEHLSGKQAIVMARGGAAIVSQLGAAKARWQTHLSQLECRADEVEQDAAATSPIADGALLP